jgi:hypothetical protein
LDWKEDTNKAGLTACADPEKGIDVSDDTDIIRYTIDFWRRRSGVELTAENARAMIADTCGFFQLLDRWDREICEEVETDLDCAG